MINKNKLMIALCLLLAACTGNVVDTGKPYDDEPIVDHTEQAATIASPSALIVGVSSDKPLFSGVVTFNRNGAGSMVPGTIITYSPVSPVNMVDYNTNYSWCDPSNTFTDKVRCKDLSGTTVYAICPTYVNPAFAPIYAVNNSGTLVGWSTYNGQYQIWSLPGSYFTRQVAGSYIDAGGHYHAVCPFTPNPQSYVLKAL